MQLLDKHIDELKFLVNKALGKLYDQDYLLIEHAVNERSAVFRFGIYFSDLLSGSSFQGYDLDCEYNRNMGSPKRTRRFPAGVVPDVLLHRRNSNKENVLVLEFKGYWNRTPRVYDEKKIAEFVSQDEKNDYKYGLGGVVELRRNSFNVEYSCNYD